jgi:hypothetical protein
MFRFCMNFCVLEGMVNDTWTKIFLGNITYHSFGRIILMNLGCRSRNNFLKNCFRVGWGFPFVHIDTYYILSNLFWGT